ncbi:MAG: hypothetical protein PUE01_10250 [Clostridiaceae bacterium]|nr:hypothetical protein [Clostridiaceae bacterium]
MIKFQEKYKINDMESIISADDSSSNILVDRLEIVLFTNRLIIKKT